MRKIKLIFVLCVCCTFSGMAQLDIDSVGNIVISKNIYLSSASNFLGTIGNFPITFKVNNVLAGFTGKSGIDNVSFGYESLKNSGPELGNVAIGVKALYSNTDGGANTAVGYQALYNNTWGSSNTAVGYQALYSSTWSGSNTANGYQALYSNDEGDGNTANGAHALYNNTGGSSNTANGYCALYGNMDGRANTANGYCALYGNTDGSYNIANGIYALRSNTNGSYNTAIGTDALYYNTTGSCNIAIGLSALYTNTIGDCNTAIGYEANFSAGTNLSNATAIGNNAAATSSNQVRIGNGMVTSIGGYVGWTNFSDGRAKKNIRTEVPGLAFINRLQPITYNLDLDAIDDLLKIDRTGKTGEDTLKRSLPQKLIDFNRQAREAKQNVVQTGFVAQDVERMAKSIGYDFSGVDVDELGIYGLRYSEFVVPLVKAVQELSEQNNQLQERVNQLTELVSRLLEKESKETK